MSDLEMDIYHNGLPALQQLPLILRVYMNPVMESIGQNLRTGAVNAIRSQSPPGGGSWDPLSARHLSYKIRKNYSTNIYIMTSTYMQNIASVYDASTTTLSVGVFRGVMHAGDGKSLKPVELYQIASTLEFGNPKFKIPARPLWRPLLSDQEHSIRTRVGIAVSQALKYIAKHQPPSP